MMFASYCHAAAQGRGTHAAVTSSPHSFNKTLRPPLSSQLELTTILMAYLSHSNIQSKQSEKQTSRTCDLLQVMLHVHCDCRITLKTTGRSNLNQIVENLLQDPNICRKSAVSVWLTLDVIFQFRIKLCELILNHRLITKRVGSQMDGSHANIIW